MQQTDTQLVNAARAGSLDNFDTLMIRYQKLVFKIAVNFTRDRDHALDVTQNVFLKAYQKLDSLADPARFKPWLMRITYHEALAWQRGTHVGAECEGAWDPEASAAEIDSQEQQLVSDEERRSLARRLARLNPKYRLAVVLKYFEGLSIKDIASVLQCSEAVVKNMLYRSMQRMAGRGGRY